MGLTCFNRPSNYHLSCRNSREEQRWRFTWDVSLRFLAVWMTPLPPSPSCSSNARKARACAVFQAPFPRAKSSCRAADGKISLFSCFHALKFSLSCHSARRHRMALHGSVSYRSETTASSPGCLTLLTRGHPNLMLQSLCSLKLHTAG